MMDLSDGLATDLAHLCAASRVEAEIDAGKLPISPDLTAAAEYLSVSSLELVLKGGEDYQLLFTAPAAHDAALRRLVADGAEGESSRFGRIVAGNGVHLLHEDEQGIEITYQGYDHFNTSWEKQSAIAIPHLTRNEMASGFIMLARYLGICRKLIGSFLCSVVIQKTG